MWVQRTVTETMKENMAPHLEVGGSHFALLSRSNRKAKEQGLLANQVTAGTKLPSSKRICTILGRSSRERLCDDNEIQVMEFFPDCMKILP